MSWRADYGTHVDHCEGTLVAHGDGAVDCTNATCPLPDPMYHALIIDCAAVTGGCCADPGTEYVAHAQ